MEETDIVVVDTSPGALVQSDPTVALENTEKLVRYMTQKCAGPKFIAPIQGRNYPKVEWWTTAGMALGLTPVEISSERHDFEGGYKYLAVVEVRRGETIITRASAICSTEERSWGKRDEYAVKSMATTRATGKAYRIGLSALAVMAGLEPTPADEIPPQGFSDRRTAPVEDLRYGTCPEHHTPFFKRGKMKSPAHKYGPNDPADGPLWCNAPDDMSGDAPAAPRADAALIEAKNQTMKMVEDLIGAGDDLASQRGDYVMDKIDRAVIHPDDITAEEWNIVADAAAEDMNEMQMRAE